MRTKNKVQTTLFVLLIFASHSCSIKNDDQYKSPNLNDLLLNLGVEGDSGPAWDNNSIRFYNYQDTIVYLPDSFPLVGIPRISRHIYDVSESMLTVCKMKENIEKYSGLCVELQGDILDFFRRVLALPMQTRLYVMEEVTYHPSYRSFIVLSMRDNYLMDRGYDDLFLVNIKGNMLLSYVNLSFLGIDLHGSERRYTKTDQKTFVSMVYVSGDFEDFDSEESLYSEKKALMVCTAFEFDEEGYLKFLSP